MNTAVDIDKKNITIIMITIKQVNKKHILNMRSVNLVLSLHWIKMIYALFNVAALSLEAMLRY